jgi:transketolase
MRTAFIKTITEIAAQDSRVMLVTGDLGFGVVLDFAKRFPKQFLNAGIAEQNIAGLSAGLALSGKVVFIYSIGNFPTLRCFEQIRNDVCYHNANVKVVAIGAGCAYGALGSTHHATEDLAVMRALPQMTVLSPGDPMETEEAVRAAVTLQGPVYLRLGRAGEPIVHKDPIPFQVGKALMVRSGSAFTLIATGGILFTAVNVADRLAKEGTEARVLSMHTVRPLDVDAVLAAARETGVVVTLEEHSITGGLGGAVAEVLCESGLQGVFFKRLGLPSAFIKQVGDQDYLRRVHGLGEDEVLAIVRRIVHTATVQYGQLPRKLKVA